MANGSASSNYFSILFFLTAMFLSIYSVQRYRVLVQIRQSGDHHLMNSRRLNHRACNPLRHADASSIREMNGVCVMMLICRDRVLVPDKQRAVSFSDLASARIGAALPLSSIKETVQNHHPSISRLP